MAYMPQEKSRSGYKYGAKDTYNKGEAYSNEGSEMGYLKGYQDYRNHPVSYPEVITKPQHTHTPEDSFETKTTETIVEYSHVPMVTHDRPREDEFIQTEVSRPIKPRPIGSLYWWQTANYKGYGGSNNYGRPSDPRTDIYNKARVNGNHQHNMDGLIGKSESVPEDRQDYRINTTDNWTRPSQGSKEIPSKFTKPTNDVGIAPEYQKEAAVIAAPPQGRLPPPVGSRVVAKQPAIDSNEAARRFGVGVVAVAPVAKQLAIDSNEAARRFGGVVAIAPVEPTSIIDSREAEWKYRGIRV